MDSHECSEKCRQVFALLSDYLNLELPPESLQQIETHLAGCLNCTEFAASLRQAVELCRSYRITEAPAALDPKARSKLLDAYRRALSAPGPRHGNLQ
jgi:predicted anti-sigma-YlaC factor YlaD